MQYRYLCCQWKQLCTKLECTIQLHYLVLNLKCTIYTKLEVQFQHKTKFVRCCSAQMKTVMHILTKQLLVNLSCTFFNIGSISALRCTAVHVVHSLSSPSHGACSAQQCSTTIYALSCSEVHPGAQKNTKWKRFSKQFPLHCGALLCTGVHSRAQNKVMSTVENFKHFR